MLLKGNLLTENTEDPCMVWSQQFHLSKYKCQLQWFPFQVEEFSLHQAVQPSKIKIVHQSIYENNTSEAECTNFSRDTKQLTQLIILYSQGIHGQRVLEGKYKEKH